MVKKIEIGHKKDYIYRTEGWKAFTLLLIFSMLVLRGAVAFGFDIAPYVQKLFS